MRITNVQWDGSETSLSVPGFGEYPIDGRVVNVPDAAGSYLIGMPGHVGYISAAEVIEVVTTTEAEKKVNKGGRPARAKGGDTNGPEAADEGADKGTPGQGDPPETSEGSDQGTEAQ